MTVDDVVGHPETESGAVEIFGGKEWLKDASARDFIHAVTVVCDSDANARSSGGVVSRLVSAHEECSSTAHGIDRICD